MKREPLWQNAVVHIFNRGVEGRTIFEDDRDRARFLATCHLANSPGAPSLSRLECESPEEALRTSFPEHLMRMLLVVLMPNHFHQIGETGKPDSVSKVMQRALNSYTKGFNARHERQYGRLFQNAYGMTVVKSGDDPHLKYLIAYVALNPVSLIYPGWEIGLPVPDRNAAIRFLETYPNSNLPDLLCGVESPTCGLLCVPPEDGLLRFYGSREALREQIFAYLH